jgi:alpha-glucoside transport system substrate-binding protein
MRSKQQIIADGAAPWCIGHRWRRGSGWPGTDWVEDIMLRTAGPETYDQWWQHEIPWTDEAVKVNAFETWGTIVTDPAKRSTAARSVCDRHQLWRSSFTPMFEDDPGCYLHRQASFITTFFEDQFPDLVAG